MESYTGFNSENLYSKIRVVAKREFKYNVMLCIAVGLKVRSGPRNSRTFCCSDCDMILKQEYAVAGNLEHDKLVSSVSTSPRATSTYIYIHLQVRVVPLLGVRSHRTEQIYS